MIEYGARLGEERNARGSGEPAWMPSPDEVIRARRRMERAGIIGAMRLDPEDDRLVPPGETPWLWWGLAVFWIVSWPALISLKIGFQALPRIPIYWLLGLALLHLLILAGPVVRTQRMAGRAGLGRRFRQIRTLAELLALEPSEFEVWAGTLFRLLGYQVRNTKESGDHGIDLVVSSPQIRAGLVQCKRYRGTVGEPTIRDLYGTLMHENADFAWLVTTGAISRQALDWSAGKPMELWDGQRLIEVALSLE